MLYYKLFLTALWTYCSIPMKLKVKVTKDDCCHAGVAVADGVRVSLRSILGYPDQKMYALWYGMQARAYHAQVQDLLQWVETITQLWHAPTSHDCKTQAPFGLLMLGCLIWSLVCSFDLIKKDLIKFLFMKFICCMCPILSSTSFFDRIRHFKSWSLSYFSSQ